MRYVVQSPTRIDLAGGTLDCWPIYLFFNHCVTVNLSVSIFTFVDLVSRPDSEIHLEIQDFDFHKSYKDLGELLRDGDDRLALIRQHLQFWQPSKGFHLKTRSDSPVGGGLGGSSSLCIGLIKAFGQWLGREADKEEAILWASNIEAQVLQTPTGTQDYFPAFEPGLHTIHYGPWGARDELIEFPLKDFRESMFLVYTGKPHHSGMNNWQVLKAVIDKDSHVRQKLGQLREVAFELEEVCRAQRWKELPQLFNAEFEHRVSLSPAFTCPEIESLREVVLRSGGLAVKICGAGGGGCVLVWTAPENKQQVMQECQKEGFQVLNASPVVKV
ncbi:MAG: galactokinase [Bdellovibrionales bacterium]|nr:galactokinase [Bdellovibrionales bacterium]